MHSSCAWLLACIINCVCQEKKTDLPQQSDFVDLMSPLSKNNSITCGKAVTSAWVQVLTLKDPLPNAITYQQRARIGLLCQLMMEFARMLSCL